MTLYFEDWRKCQDVNANLILSRRKRIVDEEKNMLEKFLIDNCENEVEMMIQTSNA